MACDAPVPTAADVVNVVVLTRLDPSAGNVDHDSEAAVYRRQHRHAGLTGVVDSVERDPDHRTAACRRPSDHAGSRKHQNCHCEASFRPSRHG
jgi:hypothetical protein